MKRMSYLALGGVLMFTVAVAAAQVPTRVLNKLEVQRLVTADTPEAHAALAKHFIALADQYQSEADLYGSMSKASVGNPNHPAVGESAKLLRGRQAEQAAGLAESARDMASFHQLRSIGMSAKAPRARAAFDGGAGAPNPTAAELQAFETSARTAADHRTLQEYFLMVADEQTATANDHQAMAGSFRVSGQRSGAEYAALHCDSLARKAHDAARKAAAAAERHRQLANVG